MTNLTKLDRYIIQEKCGSGGMATVYRAVDPDLDQAVAIKVLPTTFNERDDMPRRFKREARTLAVLQHPAIVPILNFGEVDSHLYFVMPYLSGGSLRERLNDGPLPLADVVAVVDRIASALEAAHQKQIIHRDVKPHNILFDAHGEAFLADFGVARLLDRDDAEQTVTLIGTPEFMSPEQVLEGDLSPQTDIYQLGVVIFQMLTGWLPFEGAAHHVMSQHLHAPLPSAVALNPQLPPATDAILQRALAKDPAERFDSAVSLHKALLELLVPSSEPLTIAPAVGVVVDVPVRQRPFLTKTSLALSALALVGVMGISLPQLLPMTMETSATEATVPVIAEPEPTAVPSPTEAAEDNASQPATAAQTEADGQTAVANAPANNQNNTAQTTAAPPPPDGPRQGNRPPRQGSGNGNNGNPPPPPAP
ncbi:MAG: protein kinase [Anaerolineales bacterium]|nr:protein kinase [Anaerolineales bacterium]